MFHLTKDDFLGDLPQISGAKMGQVSTSSPELNFLGPGALGQTGEENPLERAVPDPFRLIANHR